MPLYISILSIVVLASGFVLASQATQRPESILIEETVTTTKETIPSDASFEIDIATPPFGDGKYTTSLAYEVPYGYIEPMRVSFVFKDGVITDAEVKLEAKNPTSAGHQNAFMEYYRDEVIGQLIEVVSLSRLGGASLTNYAFDVALAAAKAEASGIEMDVPEIVPMKLSTYSEDSQFENTEDVYFKDGTYTVEDAYYVMPGLSEPMHTTITLNDGIITDASVAFGTKDIHSEYHQRGFVAAYKAAVIGVSITDVPFSRIGGASLTTGGFNDALQKVMNRASER